MLGQHEVENVCAQSSRRDGAHKDVGIESDSHETSRNTSSSVRYPLASARGIILRRRSWNWTSDNWRRTASRTISLRLKPARFAALSNYPCWFPLSCAMSTDDMPNRYRAAVTKKQVQVWETVATP
jgi:hypothetical protein